MNITEMEHRYRLLLKEWQAGRIDQATFEAGIDRLQLQDEGGCTWMIGAQSGAWYCYDGQNWRQADPRQVQWRPLIAEQSPAPPESVRFQPGKPFLFSSAVLAMLAVLMFLPLLALPVGASPADLPALAPSPRPPLDEGGGSGSGSGDGGGSGGGNGPAQGAIVGTVTDLSLGLPAAGVEVSVNGAIVRSDTDGAYSATGLPAGTYTVSPELQGQGMPAQGPVFVSLDGRSVTVIDLAYYSQPLPTDTPQPAAAAAPPPTLPGAGGPASPWPLLLMWWGLVLIVGGSVLRFVNRTSAT